MSTHIPSADDARPSGLHPRLGDPAIPHKLGERWRDTGVVWIEDALAPGLAAQLWYALSRLPLAVALDPGHDELSWRCSVVMPDAFDPQYPESMFRAAWLLDDEVPALARAITGRALTHSQPRGLRVHVYRKGSYVDAGRPLAPPGGVDVALGLTDARWPASWGGHVALHEARGQPVSQPAPLAAGTLALLDAPRLRVPLLTHHVERALLRAALIPAPEDA